MNWQINQYNSFIIVVTYNKGILYKEVTSILLHHKEAHVACTLLGLMKQNDDIQTPHEQASKMVHRFN